MEIYKDLAKHGRFGDTMIKEIDGEPTHVSPEEYNMSPEEIKALGAGTINPVTGKKEYFIGALIGGIASLFSAGAAAVGTGLAAIGGGSALTGAGVALTAGSAIYKGVQASRNKGDVAQLEKTALDTYNAKLGLLGEREDISNQTSKLGFDITKEQVALGQENIGMGANMALRKTQAFGEQSQSQSNLATSGTIQQKTQTQETNVLAKHANQMKKLVDTRKFATVERKLSEDKADLAKKAGEVKATEEYQNTLTGLSNIPTTFGEGFFS